MDYLSRVCGIDLCGEVFFFEEKDKSSLNSFHAVFFLQFVRVTENRKNIIQFHKKKVIQKQNIENYRIEIIHHQKLDEWDLFPQKPQADDRLVFDGKQCFFDSINYDH